VTLPLLRVWRLTFISHTHSLDSHMRVDASWFTPGRRRAQHMASHLTEECMAFRRELRAIRTVIPQWKIENDLRVPKISLKNSVPGLFFRPPPSSVVSSTRAAPPASPVPLPTQKTHTTGDISWSFCPLRDQYGRQLLA